MSTEAPKPHVRRKRYRGTHPRKFAEKYKEHDPQKFAADVEKVIARGQTPAGTHRPICVDEILAILSPKPGDTVLDATLGYGGHTQAILPCLQPGGKLFAVDADTVELPRTEARLRAAGFDEAALSIHQMNFSQVATLLPKTAGGFDGVLADLGVSSMQLDNPVRGFSYKNDGPLDLRLDPSMGASAAMLLQQLTAEALATLLTEHADEPHAKRIAYAVHRERDTIATTRRLAEVVRAALKDFPEKKDHKKTLARTFMALRIAVNNEFSALDQFLAALLVVTKPGARIAILSFHSGEDRRVAETFQRGLAAGVFARIAPDAARASPDEQRSNPRSSSAKLRWAVRA